MPRKQFVSESIQPVAGSFAAGATGVGEPALPMRFVWRGVTYEVAQVPCRPYPDPADARMVPSYQGGLYSRVGS